jgi:hypothetical protein
MARARVRWGNSRFWRINEFATEDGARAFVEELRRTHYDDRSLAIHLEVRNGDRWVPVDHV